MNKHLILAIDNAEEEVRPLIPDEFEAVIIHPDDPKLSDALSELIGAASLILLDQKFNEDPNPLSMMAADGASFVAHLRSWSRLKGKGLPPIMLFTNDGEAFKNEIPTVGAAVPLNGTFVDREFRIAPALDVEWVQYKAEECTMVRIRQLVHASVAARERVGEDGASLAEIESLLSLPEGRVWTDRAKEELRSARPPVSQKDDASPEPCGPSQIVRWMCHRALPFPGLFFSDLYAAWALGLSPEAFQKVTEIAAKTDWLRDLADARYLGPLDKFLGRRWWRSGIDYLVWKLDQEASRQKDRVRAFGLLAPNIEIGRLHSASTHVVAWTPDLVEGIIFPIDEAAQLRPPGWPAEAFEPWIRKADLENDAVLQAMIEAADLS